MAKTMLVEYSTNNSGGSWWLGDKDWYALEKAGWKVQWIKDEKPLKIGGRLSTIGMADKDGRWLGALAKRASKRFPSVKAAVEEFERITGQRASDEGCNCCGAPHTFYWGRAVSTYKGPKDAEYGYASGEQIISILFGEDAPKNLREAVSMLKTGGKMKRARA